MEDEKMSDREIDIVICKSIMRWPQWTNLDADYDGPYPMFADWGEGIPGMALYEDEIGGDVTRYFSPSTSIADAFEMESRIAELGLTKAYISTLVSALTDAEHAATHVWYMSEDDLFAVAHASPRARCLAALKALESR